MTDPNISNVDSRGLAPRQPNKGQRCCAECGSPFTATRKASKFCKAQCRTDWTNRRNTRGAILYDLKMAERFERDDATKAGLLAVMNRLCADWRSEDNLKRQGRKSWGDWKAYLAERPYLYAERLVRSFAGRAALKAPKPKQ